VYAKDVLDIDAFSSIRGVEIEQNDEEFASKFSTGACSKPWQEEVSGKISSWYKNRLSPPHPPWWIIYI